MLKKTTLLAVAALACQLIVAQNNLSALIPMPNNIVVTDGKPFAIEPQTTIFVSSPQLQFAAEQLQATIERHTGIKPAIVNTAAKRQFRLIATENWQQLGDNIRNDRYALSVGRNSVEICATHAGAVLYGVYTLDQIMTGDTTNSHSHLIAPIEINDRPAFDYRALMIDPARHFLPVDDVKRYIDCMARFKFNVLQLHLTDDQGWRLEIKSHPELTATGANDFYTQDQLRDLIDYAAQRNVMIVPEIDIPGHTAAILATHPELCCTVQAESRVELGTTNVMLCASNSDTYPILDDIIVETAALFRSPFIHIGGDEAAVENNWAKCDKCRAMAASKGYNKATDLMNDFFAPVFESIRRNGKQPMMWCELDNIRMPAKEYMFPYPKDVVLVTWRHGLTPLCMELSKKSGNALVVASGEHCYLDYPQYRGDLPEYNNWGMPVTTLQQSYRLEPTAGKEYPNIAGVMATLWGEAIVDINRLFYMTYPRAMAIAEAGWTLPERRSWPSFVERLYPNITTLIKSGVAVRAPFELALPESDPRR